jgi:hypothetical protein
VGGYVYLTSLFPFSFLPFPLFPFLSYILFPFSEVLINVAAPQRGDRVTTSFLLKTWLSQQRLAKIFPKYFHTSPSLLPSSLLFSPLAA